MYSVVPHTLAPGRTIFNIVHIRFQEVIHTELDRAKADKACYEFNRGNFASVGPGCHKRQ